MKPRRKVTLLIKASDGSISGLDTPEFRQIVEPLGVKVEAKQRASHIVPVNLPLRMIFWVIRSVVSDESWIAAFTRKWSCLWRVDLRKSGGEIHAPFKTRDEAVEFEHSWVEARLGAIVPKLNKGQLCHKTLL